MGRRKKPSKRGRNKANAETKPIVKSIGIKSKKTKSEPKPKKTTSVTAVKTSKRLQQKAAINGSTTQSIADSNSKTASVVSVRPSADKRRTKSDKATDSQFFTQREKKAFYESLSENGFNIINNEKFLLKLFTNRSITEIKAMIESYTRKAQELNRRSDETVESDPNSNKQPIEKWFDVIHQMVPNYSKKDDISVIFVDVFNHLKDLAKLESKDLSDGPEDLIPNYEKIYNCIQNSLNGKFAEQLEPIDAFVVVKLIEELKQLLINDEYEAEAEFLSSGQWWQQTDQKSNEDELRSVYLQRQQQNAIESNVTETAQNGTSSHESNAVCVEPLDVIDNSVDNNFSVLVKYPKLRKIVECLNPLKVPINLTQKEYNRWQ